MVTDVLVMLLDDKINIVDLQLEIWELITVYSGTGIVILAQDSGFVPQITLTDSAESYIRREGEVEQHSKVGCYERLPSLLEQVSTEWP